MIRCKIILNIENYLELPGVNPALTGWNRITFPLSADFCWKVHFFANPKLFTRGIIQLNFLSPEAITIFAPFPIDPRVIKTGTKPIFMCHNLIEMIDAKKNNLIIPFVIVLRNMICAAKKIKGFNWFYILLFFYSQNAFYNTIY